MNGKKQILDLNSKIGELYATPIGHDTIYKVLLQLGISEKAITNRFVANLKLKTLVNLTKKQLGEGFFDCLLHLINSEQDVPFVSRGKITQKWWKEAVFYQIYPRSFCDANGDGIGDIQGIISKLDYLKELGIDALWLSPIYDSPNDDNGYDIRDYHKIMTEFGTMEDFDLLLTKVHEKGMRLIMDLVVNHTSDEHKWFQEALMDETSPYRDYYFFRKGNGGQNNPNNWTSFFSGSAWNYYDKQDVYALHLFSKKQMDLNWDNANVREDVIKMVNWWLDKGVDGFRLDVINYISKEKGLPEGNPIIGNMMGFTGIENYYYGPNLHTYLKELQEKAFGPHGAFSVGETPGVGMKMCQLLTGEERKELDMVFSFDHLETPGHVRFDDYTYDLNYYRDYMIDWMTNYGNNCWMSLFYNNHDNPRMVSKVSTNPKHTENIEILLAVMQLTLKGTPFIFQGDEMGLVNYQFTSMEQITDVEAKGYYQELLEKKSPEEALRIVVAGTREHCRVLLPWNEKKPDYHKGLTQSVNEKMTDVYRELIALRKCEKALVYGNFEVLDKKKNRFVYKRTLEGTEFVIDCNLGETEQRAYTKSHEFTQVFPMTASDNKLAAYEARIYKKG